MKKLALDTNIAIDLLNGVEEIKEKIQENAEIVCLPSVVCGELLYGAKNSGKKDKNLERYRKFISVCEVLGSNSAVEEAYSDIRKTLKDKGKPIPENDVWIAATCVAYQVPLATRDKHFEEVEDLDLLKM